MSEPMSTGEIEDVLSSIRRLVTEDLRPTARPDAPSSKLKVDGAKLILTPALRIVPEKKAEQVIRSAPPYSPKQPDPVDEPELLSPAAAEGPADDDNIAGLTDSSDDAAQADNLLVVGNDETIPHSGRGAESDIADDFKFSSSRTDWKPEDEASEDVVLPEDWNEAPSAIHPVSKLTGVVSAIGAAVGGVDEEWESETGDSSLRHLPWQPPVWDDDTASEDDYDDSEEQEDEVNASAPLQEDAPETVEDDEDDELNVDQTTVTTDDIGELPVDELDEVYEAPTAARANADIDASLPDEAELLPDLENYIDEAVLRDMVRQLIREELSGTLGERITRNVRKLVRAEINRALTSRDFD